MLGLATQLQGMPSRGTARVLRMQPLQGEGALRSPLCPRGSLQASPHIQDGRSGSLPLQSHLQWPSPLPSHLSPKEPLVGLAVSPGGPA